MKFNKLIICTILIVSTTLFINLHFYRINLHELFFRDILNTLIFLSIFSVIFMIAINFFIKNLYSSSILTTIYIILFFSYYYILDFILYKNIFGFVYGRSQVLFPIYILFYILLFLCHKLYSKKLFNFIWLFISILILFEIFSIFTTKKDFTDISPLKYDELNYNFDFDAVKDKPDIYYIILDEYARKDTLMDYYKFDNSTFINMLKEKGFYVANKSHSNYPATLLSIPATFNMNYINFLSTKKTLYSKNTKPLIKLFQKNQVSYFLNKLDYYYVHIASGYNMTNSNIYSDKRHYWGLLDYYSSFLIDLTPLRIFKKYLTAEDRRIRIKKSLEYLKNIPSNEKNIFVFAHILCPHFPY